VRVQDALVQEHILTLLTKPVGDTVVGKGGARITGLPYAHYEALRFITHVLMGSRFQDQLEPTQLDALTSRHGPKSWG